MTYLVEVELPIAAGSKLYAKERAVYDAISRLRRLCWTMGVQIERAYVALDPSGIVALVADPNQRESIEKLPGVKSVVEAPLMMRSHYLLTRMSEINLRQLH